MLQQTELKQIGKQIFPVIKEEIAKIAVTEVKKALPKTTFKKTNGDKSQPLDYQLLERIVRVEEQLVAQGKMIESIITQMNKINAEQREYSDKINAEQREYSDKINAEQGKRIELLISQIDKRNAEQREDSDKRHKEQREDSNERHKEQIEYSDKRFEAVDKRFEDMNKRFTHFQWIITAGFLLATLLIAAFQFFLQNQTL